MKRRSTPRTPSRIAVRLTVAAIGVAVAAALVAHLLHLPPHQSALRSLVVREPAVNRQPEVAYVVSDGGSHRVVARDRYSEWSAITYGPKPNSMVVGTVTMPPDPRPFGMLFPTRLGEDPGVELEMLPGQQLGPQEAADARAEFAQSLLTLRQAGLRTISSERIEAAKTGALSVSAQAIPSGYVLDALLVGAVCAALWGLVSAGLAARGAWRLGQRRCPSCGYSLEGLDAKRCPECGAVLSRA